LAAVRRASSRVTKLDETAGIFWTAAQPLSTTVHRQGYRTPGIFGGSLHSDRPLPAVRMAVFRGILPMCGMGTTDRPLPAVRMDMTTPVRPADGRGLHVYRGERHGAERERQRDQISRKIFHCFYSIRAKNWCSKQTLGLAR
jgi:hypothetical protein